MEQSNNNFRIEVCFVNGRKIRLLEEFENLCDANAEASAIKSGGMRVCLDPERMSYIPVNMISTVFVTHAHEVFGLTAVVADHYDAT